MDYKLSISKLITIDGISAEEIGALIVPPKDPSHGDYALPCFRFAKALKKSPVEIAETLAREINLHLSDTEWLTEAVPAAGYLNFKINKQKLASDTIASVLTQGADYASSDIGKGKTICIDYSGLNIAKPFHIGHLSATVTGAAIYRILKKLGYNAVGINHLGDWGTQFGKLIVAYKKWGNKDDIEARGVRALLDIYVRFHDEAEKDAALNDEGRAWFKKIEDGDTEAVSYLEWFKEITLKEVGKIYKRLNVSFDSYAGESFYNDKISPVIKRLKEKNLLSESEGAQVVKFEGDEMPPCLILRSDGASLYATRDLAAMLYRKKTYDFYKCLYVVAYQQNLHFKQVFKVVEMMGYDWAKDLEHVAFGMVSLEDGSMSTRKGRVAFLDETLDKAAEKALSIINEKAPDLEGKEQVSETIGTGAVIFGALSSSRIKDIVFSLDKVLSFEGETAPYIQYTVARTNSIFDKAGNTSITDITHLCSIDNDEGNEVIRLIARYPEVILSAAEKYEPSFIARHAIDLAQAFNKFYFEHKIKDDPARLALTACVRIVLKDAMSLLGIDCPEKM